MQLQIPQANLFQRGIQWLAAKPFASRILARVLPGLDRRLMHMTNGKLNATSFLAGLPVIMLTTIGAKSRQKRLSPLITIPDGDKLIVIASNFGNNHHPTWYHNILENPQVEVALPPHSPLPFLARPALGKDRIKYWEAALQLYPGFHAYKERAAPRKIPIVVLQKA